MELLLDGNSRRRNSKAGGTLGKMTPGEKVIFVIATIFVIVGAITMVFPYLWMFISSLKSYEENMSTTLILWPKEPNWAVFSTVFQDNKYNLFRAIGNTMVIEVPVIIVGTLTTTMAAFAFAKLKFKFKKTILIILMTSMMIPYAAVMLPQYRVWMIIKDSLGIDADSIGMLLPLIVPGLFCNIGMCFFLITSMKNGIHDSVIESAKVDGCSYFRMWWQLALPLSKSAIAAQCIFWFVGIWNDYFAPSMYLSGQTKTIAVVVNSIVGEQSGGLRTAEMFACAFVSSIPMIVIFLIFRNMFVTSIAMSGVKE